MKRRLWKHVYDQMGGCSNNTSAATGTRRNYEKSVVVFVFQFKRVVIIIIIIIIIKSVYVAQSR